MENQVSITTATASDHVHPCLRGGQPTPQHRFTSAQMKTLAAICDTLFPRCEPPRDETCVFHHAPKELALLESYYRLAASDMGVPLEAAGYMAKLLKKSQFDLVSLALHLLNSSLGTLILGGKHALSSTFPFILPFASLPIKNRQDLFLSFIDSFFHVKQDIFRFFKCFLCWIIFTKVDKVDWNPTFEAFHYRPGEDDDLSGREGPCALSGSIVDASVVGLKLGRALTKLGAQELSHVGHLQALERRSNGVAYANVGLRVSAVVLGSGPGGAVVAARLANEGHKVLVMEKGQRYEVSDLSQLEGPSMYAMYEESGCLVTDDSRMILLAGATVGGGSTINWSASFRTPDHVRSEWAQSLQLDLFSSSVYDRAMDAVCSRLQVQRDVESENFPNATLRAGCTALGYHVDNIPRNSDPRHYCGFCGLGCKQGKKRGAMTTWLEDAARSGALVLTSCRAREILTTSLDHHRRKAAGVVAEVVGGGQPIKIYVEADVVVAACGALRTPPLLWKSGLRNEAIGRNLHIHPVQLVWGYFPEGEGAEGKSYRGGIMTAFSTVAANWDTSGYGALIQCPAVQPGVVALGQPWVSGEDFKRRMRRFPRTAYLIVLTRDKGSGTVREDREGRLCVKYGLSEADKESLRVGAECGLRILMAAGATQLGTFNNDGEIFSPRGAADLEQDFEKFLGRVRAGSFEKLSTIVVSAHQMGSCCMGVHPSVSAVSPGGETWEVEGLFVADSSVLPTASGVNPMITVQSIAYCTANSVVEYLRPSAVVQRVKTE